MLWRFFFFHFAAIFFALAFMLLPYARRDIPRYSLLSLVLATVDRAGIAANSVTGYGRDNANEKRE